MAQPIIRFHELQPVPALKNRKKLKEFIAKLFKSEKKPLKRIDYIFCSDAYLLDINLRFLNHDYLTDIITFDLSDTAETTAEVYISVDRVKENAQVLSIAFPHELHRVIFHGALHLCGFSDKHRREKELMRKKEEYYLGRYNVPRGT